MIDYSKPTPHAWQLFHWAGFDAHKLSADYEEERQLRRAAPEDEADG
jgi:hypothetical protein